MDHWQNKVKRLFIGSKFMSLDTLLRDKLDSLRSLNRKAFDYVIARSTTATIQAAFEAHNASNPETAITSKWFYSLAEVERQKLDNLAEQLHYDSVMQAYMILQDAAKEAARVKTAGLRSKNQYVQQGAANDILARVMDVKNQVNVIGHLTVNFNSHRPNDAPASPEPVDVEPKDA